MEWFTIPSDQIVIHSPEKLIPTPSHHWTLFSEKKIWALGFTIEDKLMTRTSCDLRVPYVSIRDATRSMALKLRTTIAGDSRIFVHMEALGVFSSKFPLPKPSFSPSHRKVSQPHFPVIFQTSNYSRVFRFPSIPP
jgi:hypothetical protein